MTDDKDIACEYCNTRIEDAKPSRATRCVGPLAIWGHRFRVVG